MTWTWCGHSATSGLLSVGATKPPCSDGEEEEITGNRRKLPVHREGLCRREVTPSAPLPVHCTPTCDQGIPLLRRSQRVSIFIKPWGVSEPVGADKHPNSVREGRGWWRSPNTFVQHLFSENFLRGRCVTRQRWASSYWAHSSPRSPVCCGLGKTCNGLGGMRLFLSCFAP